MSQQIRINKLISQLGISSRREADRLIQQGRVSLGKGITAIPGTMIDIDKDDIFLDGKKINLIKDEQRLYILLNKPIGYITTLKDTHRRRTVMDLVPKGKGFFPVGRLDKDTTGVLILTNDGEFAHRLMHPSYEIEKVYDVVLSKALQRSDIAKIETGVDIGEEKSSSLKILNILKIKGGSRITVSLHEGRKRQIRRTFSSLGYRVNALERTVYGGIETGVKAGSYRHLTDAEVTMLKKKVKLK